MTKTRAEWTEWAAKRLAYQMEKDFVKEMNELYAAQATGRKTPRVQPKPPLPRASPAGRLYPLIQLCIAHGLPEPRPEYNFHPSRGWRFDYAWPERKIAVEIEGGIWRRGGGAHSHPLNIERDMEKYNQAAVLGWRVLRVAPERISNIMDDLREILK